MQSTLKKDAGSEWEWTKEEKERTIGRTCYGKITVLSYINSGFKKCWFPTRHMTRESFWTCSLPHRSLWCEGMLYTGLIKKREMGQTKSPIKTTFLILNVDSVCWQVKQGMKAYPMHSKSGNTLNVTECVFRRVERQGSVMGRVLDWQSGTGELTS